MMLKAAGPMLKEKLPELKTYIESKRTELINSGKLQQGEDIALTMVQIIKSPDHFAIGLLKVGTDGNASFIAPPVETIAIININEPDTIIQLLEKLL